ncbi:hypothetical protein A2767_05705 [Candidatus Roizmanbacteria bacterium RIFCSPHIGHO2_01_FULL_35_10]|nr:MAG: hypothetical protein A2767_05705 [Candidatus Roizmanbacteria bacterium RIFCSPHIGHO2_01_FULL_35_10]
MNIVFVIILLMIVFIAAIILIRSQANKQKKPVQSTPNQNKKNQEKYVDNRLWIEDAEQKKELPLTVSDNSFLSSIVESADDAIIGKTLDGCITSWNKGAEKLYGYTAGEAVGQPASIIYPPELKDELPKILDRIKNREHVKNYETVRMDNAGRRIPVSISISPVFDQKGAVTGVASIDRDFTKEKELDRLKDEFISLTSHALRTPLSAIKGLISMIYQGDYGPMNKNLEKPIANISVSTERLIQLVNDLLNISRVQTGKLEFVLTQFSVAKSIEKVVKQLDPLVKQNNLELKFIQQNIADVQADIAKTEDILNNLLSNALKFTNKGSIEISLKIENDFIIILVKDTGIGISEKDKAKLFQRFQQIVNPTSKQIAGTGLGLYLSKMLAKKMGGDVWLFNSELKKGSTFAFSLPKFDSLKAKEVKESLILNRKN